jgi:hypothetical protein
VQWQHWTTFFTLVLTEFITRKLYWTMAKCESKVTCLVCASHVTNSSISEMRCTADVIHTSQELLHTFSTSQCCKVSWHRCTFFASLASYTLGPSSQRCIMHVKSKGSALSRYATEPSKLYLNLKSCCTISSISFSY